MSKQLFHQAKAAHGGFSLVELMVGIVIALVGTLVIFQVFAVSESYRRTTSGSGDAQQNGAIAMFSIERDLRQAGYGFSDLIQLGCSLDGYNETFPAGTENFSLPPPAFPAGIKPVIITQNATAGGDRVEFIYTTYNALSNPVQLAGNYAGNGDVLATANDYGFRPGDLFVLSQTDHPCQIGQVTAVPGGNKVEHVHKGSYTNRYGKTEEAIFNKYGGMGVSYDKEDAVVHKLGQIVSRWYVVDGGRLKVGDNLNPCAPDPACLPEFSDGIVSLQAQYGIDTNNDDFVDTWQEPTGAWAANALTSLLAQQVRAVHVGIVVRSGQYEKEVVTDNTSIRLWTNPDGTAGPSHALSSDDRHYRFKVYESVIPLRSMIWRP